MSRFRSLEVRRSRASVRQRRGGCLIALGEDVTRCCSQAAKFALYVAVPIVLTGYFVFNPDNLQAIIRSVSRAAWLELGPAAAPLTDLAPC